MDSHEMAVSNPRGFAVTRLEPGPVVPSGAGFGRSLDPQQRKRLVLDAAASLFETRGFHGTSMLEIANQVGITKAALYHYVDSKEQLLFEIHDAFVSTMLDETKSFFAHTSDPLERLRFLVDSIFRCIARYRPYVRAFFQDVHNLGPEWQEGVREKRNEYEQMARDCLHAGLATGEFDFPMDPGLATMFLFGSCNWAYQWMEPDGRVAPEELSELWFELLRKAFMPVSGSVPSPE